MMMMIQECCILEFNVPSYGTTCEGL
jgi:hypothetical protein